MAGENSDGIFGAVAPRWGGDPNSHRKRHSTGPNRLTNWESNDAWDIMAGDGTPVYAIAPGVVSRVKSSSSPTKESTIYGDQISVSGVQGHPSVYYTHIKSAVSSGNNVAVGDLIGYIVRHENNPEMPTHVHIGISDGISIGKYVATNGYLMLKKPAGSGSGSGSGEGATPEKPEESQPKSYWESFLTTIGTLATSPGEIIKFFETWLRGLYLEPHNLQTLRDDFENSMFVPDDLEKPILDTIDKIIIEAGGKPKTETGAPVSGTETEEEEEEETVTSSLAKQKEIKKYSYKSRPPFGRSNKKWEW
jgi:Peptidase family M23